MVNRCLDSGSNDVNYRIGVVGGSIQRSVFDELACGGCHIRVYLLECRGSAIELVEFITVSRFNCKLSILTQRKSSFSEIYLKNHLFC